MPFILSKRVGSATIQVIIDTSLKDELYQLAKNKHISIEEMIREILQREKEKLGASQ